MTQEEKELLLKDLCARLPYGIKCYYNSPEIDDDVPEGISIIKGFQNDGILVEIESGEIIDIEDVKPYLRPMSSMTEEEQLEYSTFGFSITEHINADRINCPKYTVIETKEVYAISSIIDWLNKHHFDYRGLIDKGLALEVPERMYEKEK